MWKKIAKNHWVYGRYRLYYQTYGQGKEIIVAFHGYGQDQQVFREMGQRLGSRYTLYGIDLFFHGGSSWLSRGTSLSNTEWCAIIQHFLQSQQVVRFSLMGYSLGGKFALTLVECFAERIDRLFLIAPDGIKVSFWYRFASATMLGNYLLRVSVTRPRFLFTAIKVARRFTLVNKGMLKFVQGHMDTPKKRYAVYCRWTVLRGIKPDLPRVIRRCNRQAIEVHFYVGQFDRVIKAKNIVSLHKKLKHSEIHVLPSGHTTLIHATAQHLSEQR